MCGNFVANGLPETSLLKKTELAANLQQIICQKLIWILKLVANLKQMFDTNLQQTFGIFMVINRLPEPLFFGEAVSVLSG